KAIDIAATLANRLTVGSNTMMHRIALTIEVSLVGNWYDFIIACCSGLRPWLWEFVGRSGHITRNRLMPFMSQDGDRPDGHVRAKAAGDKIGPRSGRWPRGGRDARDQAAVY